MKTPSSAKEFVTVTRQALASILLGLEVNRFSRGFCAVVLEGTKIVYGKSVHLSVHLSPPTTRLGTAY